MTSSRNAMLMMYCEPGFPIQVDVSGTWVEFSNFLVLNLGMVRFSHHHTEDSCSCGNRKFVVLWTGRTWEISDTACYACMTDWTYYSFIFQLAALDQESWSFTSSLIHRVLCSKCQFSGASWLRKMLIQWRTGSWAVSHVPPELIIDEQFVTDGRNQSDITRANKGDSYVSLCIL